MHKIFTYVKSRLRSPQQNNNYYISRLLRWKGNTNRMSVINCHPPFVINLPFAIVDFLWRPIYSYTSTKHCYYFLWRYNLMIQPSDVRFWFRNQNRFRKDSTFDWNWNQNQTFGKPLESELVKPISSPKIPSGCDIALSCRGRTTGVTISNADIEGPAHPNI